MKVSARNQFKGTIKKIDIGSVNASVAIEIAPGIVVHSIITKTAVQELAFKVGGTAYAIIKSPNVMIGIRD